VALLLLRVLQELALDGLDLQSLGGVVVTLVAHHAQQLGGQRIVEHGDDFLAIAAIAFGDGALDDLGGRADGLLVQMEAQAVL
jgi:hypothetical protein